MAIDDSGEYPRKYLQFPLYLLRGFFADRHTAINNIIKFGIYKLSLGIKIDLNNVARQLIYQRYRGKLSDEILLCMDQKEFNHVGKDDDYNGFSDTTFNPEDEINELLTAFQTDESLKNNCIEIYRIRQALYLLKLTGNQVLILKQGLKIMGQIPEKEVMPMIGKHLLFDYRDNDKTEFEVAQLLAYIAIRSIIGEKEYAKTNKTHIVCRMFGYSSVKTIDEETLNSDLFKKYSHRYHIDRVLKHLELDWNLCAYSNKTRGIFVSISKKTPLSKLVEIAENKKLSKRLKDLDAKKRTAISTAKKAVSMQQ